MTQQAKSAALRAAAFAPIESENESESISESLSLLFLVAYR